MKLEEVIKKTRLDLGETQEQFAVRFDVVKYTIYCWEKRRRKAPYEVLEFCLEFQKAQE